MSNDGNRAEVFYSYETIILFMYHLTENTIRREREEKNRSLARCYLRVKKSTTQTKKKKRKKNRASDKLPLIYSSKENKQQREMSEAK